MKTNSLITFLAGAAVGTVLGLLLAPDKGEVTRKKMTDAAQDGRDLLRDACDKLEDALVETTGDENDLEPAGAESDDGETEGKETVSEGKSEMRGTGQSENGKSWEYVAGRKIEIA